ERLTAGEIEFYAIYNQVLTAPGRVSDAGGGCHLDAHNIERPLETHEPFHYGAPCRNVCVRGNDKAERILHLAECRGSLHKPTEENLTPEKARRHDDDWKNDRGLRISRRKPCEPLLLLHNTPPVAHYAAETFAEGAELAFLTVVKRHAFGVLTETDEAEPE